MNKLKGIQKIAVLLAVVSRETAGRLLRVFDADEQQRITQAILELENLDLTSDSIKEIIGEFRELLQSGGSAMPNVEKTLSELLSQVHGPDDAKKRMSRAAFEEFARSRGSEEMTVELCAEYMTTAGRPGGPPGGPPGGGPPGGGPPGGGPPGGGPPGGPPAGVAAGGPPPGADSSAP